MCSPNEKGRTKTSPYGSALGLPHPGCRQVEINLNYDYSLVCTSPLMKSVHCQI